MGAVLCAPCRTRIAPAREPRRVPHVDRVIAAWDYDTVARALVLGLKVRGRREAACELGRSIAERVWQEGLVADMLTWVPARRRDVQARGFDHAELIARSVALHLGIPLVPMLDRTGHRADQATLGAQDRKANLRGAFVARPAARRVAVVDDLMTTGATLSEAGRALRDAGALRVEGLVGCLVA